MKTTCLNSIKIADIQSIYPAVRRFDALKMDGLVRRDRIMAAASKEKGLQFCIPTPASFFSVWKPEQKLLTDGNQELVSSVPGFLPLDYTDGFLQQIAETCGVNRGDLDREAERFPDIAAQRINAWLHDERQLNEGRKRPVSVAETKHLLRCYAADPLLTSEKGVEWGVLRAIRSDRFRLGLDVSDLLTVIMAVVTEKKDLFKGRVDFEAAVNDSKLWFTLTNYAMTAATEVGDIVAASVGGCTSDIGMSSLTIEGRIVKLSCKNGARTGQTTRKAHLGSKLEELPDGALSNRTKLLQQAALSSELFDAISFCFEENRFRETVSKMNRNQKVPVTPEIARPIFEAVQVATGFPSETKDDLFLRFCAERTPKGEANQTKDGLVQAITALGRTLATGQSYEKALPFEAAGGRLFDMEVVEFDNLVAVAKKDPKQAAKRLN